MICNFISFLTFIMTILLLLPRLNPVGTRGFKSRMCPPYPMRVVKGD